MTYCAHVESVQILDQGSGANAVKQNCKPNTNNTRELNRKAQLAASFFTQSNRKSDSKAAEKRRRCNDDANDPRDQTEKAFGQSRRYHTQKQIYR